MAAAWMAAAWMAAVHVEAMPSVAMQRAVAMWDLIVAVTGTGLAAVQMAVLGMALAVKVCVVTMGTATTAPGFLEPLVGAHGMPRALQSTP